jgi:hypothetical protein
MFRRYIVTLESVGTQLKTFVKVEGSPKRPAATGAASGAGAALVEGLCAAAGLDGIKEMDPCVEEDVGAVLGRDLDAGAGCASSAVDGLGIESQREA